MALSGKENKKGMMSENIQVWGGGDLLLKVSRYVSTYRSKWDVTEMVTRLKSWHDDYIRLLIATHRPKVVSASGLPDLSHCQVYQIPRNSERSILSIVDRGSTVVKVLC